MPESVLSALDALADVVTAVGSLGVGGIVVLVVWLVRPVVRDAIRYGPDWSRELREWLDWRDRRIARQRQKSVMGRALLVWQPLSVGTRNLLTDQRRVAGLAVAGAGFTLTGILIGVLT